MKNKKTMLVTGGSRGIGRAIAIKFAENNYNIVITYSKNKDAAKEVLNEVNKFNVKSKAIKCDFLDSNAIPNMYNQFNQSFDNLDVLINNAGWTKYIDDHNLKELSSDLFDQIIEINLKSVYLLIKDGSELMKGNNNSIINISSIAGYNSIGSNLVYCAAKSGVNSLTKSFARILAPNIRVNGIAPGLTKTDMTSSGSKKYYDEQTLITPLGRIAEPKDIANVAFSIASDMTFVNGKTIVVDGGRLS